MPQLLAIAFLIGCLAPQSVLSKDVSDDLISGIRIIDGVCLTKRTDRLVYRHKNATNVYIAFDVLKKGMVDVFTWDILKREYEYDRILHQLSFDLVFNLFFRPYLKKMIFYFMKRANTPVYGHIALSVLR